jgi:hypothetical protein
VIKQNTMANLELYEHAPYMKFARGENLSLNAKG